MKTPESTLDSMEIKPINPKGNQPCIFFRRTDAEAEAPILWPPDAKSQLILLGKTEGRRIRGRKGMKGLDGIINSMGMSLIKLWEIEDREAWHAAVHGVTKSQIQLSNNDTHKTENNTFHFIFFHFLLVV